MDFRILGPLEVHAADGQVPVGGAKPRGLLAILLLHANEVVSNDRLIDALWGEQPRTREAVAVYRELGMEAWATRALALS